MLEDLYRVKMVDFQGVCLRRQLRFEKSSGYMFRGVCSSFRFNSEFILSILDSSNNFNDNLECYSPFSNV